MSIDGTICPKCGKEFFPTPEHVYTASGKRYCCWTCYLHRGEKRHYKYKAVRQYTLDGKYIGEFENAKQAAESMACTTETIRNACRTGKPSIKYIWKYKD